MAKVPRPGLTKTRLIPTLGAERAAELSAAMAQDVLELVAGSGIPWRVAVAGSMEDPWVSALSGSAFSTSPELVEAQLGSDLSERLAHALRDGGIAIGTDCPLLPVSLLARANVASQDVFLASADDGGYVLVGVTAEAVRRGVFTGVEWSTADTLRSQRARAEALGLDVVVVPGGYDVDDESGLRRLLDEMAFPAHTNRCVKAWAR